MLIEKSVHDIPAMLYSLCGFISWKPKLSRIDFWKESICSASSPLQRLKDGFALVLTPSFPRVMEQISSHTGPWKTDQKNGMSNWNGNLCFIQIKQNNFQPGSKKGCIEALSQTISTVLQPSQLNLQTMKIEKVKPTKPKPTWYWG